MTKTLDEQSAFLAAHKCHKTSLHISSVTPTLRVNLNDLKFWLITKENNTFPLKNTIKTPS